LADFFAGCEAAAFAFSGERVGCALPTGSLLARPVKKFVAEFFQTLLGKQNNYSSITEQSCDEHIL